MLQNGRPKRKTAVIIDKLLEEHYKRAPQKEIVQMTKKEAKTIIIARYGMLECGKHFKGTLRTNCDLCDVEDDENHRLNYCVKWKERSLYSVNEKVNFSDVHSEDVMTLRKIIPHIQSLWNVKNAHGTMHTD